MELNEEDIKHMVALVSKLEPALHPDYPIRATIYKCQKLAQPKVVDRAWTYATVS